MSRKRVINKTNTPQLYHYDTRQHRQNQVHSLLLVITVITLAAIALFGVFYGDQIDLGGFNNTTNSPISTESVDDDHDQSVGGLLDDSTIMYMALGIGVFIGGAFVLYTILSYRVNYETESGAITVIREHMETIVEFVLSMIPAAFMVTLSAVAYKMKFNTTGNYLLMMGVILLLWYSAWTYVYSMYEEKSMLLRMVFVSLPPALLILFGQLDKTNEGTMRDVTYLLSIAWMLGVFSIFYGNYKRLTLWERFLGWMRYIPVLGYLIPASSANTEKAKITKRKQNKNTPVKEETEEEAGYVWTAFTWLGGMLGYTEKGMNDTYNDWLPTKENIKIIE